MHWDDSIQSHSSTKSITRTLVVVVVVKVVNTMMIAIMSIDL